MSDTSSYIECRPRRQTRPERSAWRNNAINATFNPLGSVAQAVTRPYLLAHPEREIAAVGTHIGVAYCAACDITYKAPGTAYAGTWVFEAGKRMAAAYRFINEHNALIHPRRAARLTK